MTFCLFRAGPSLSAFNYDSVYGKKALASTYKSIMEQVRQLIVSFYKIGNLDQLGEFGCLCSFENF
jgi:hypothetical protein